MLYVFFKREPYTVGTMFFLITMSIRDLYDPQLMKKEHVSTKEAFQIRENAWTNQRREAYTVNDK